MHASQGKNTPAPDQDLKNFYVKVALDKESITAVSIQSSILRFLYNSNRFPYFFQLQKVTDDAKLVIKFKYDTLCNAHIRVNTCVTEKKNANNAPEMFYTPNRDNYIQNLTVGAGVD